MNYCPHSDIYFSQTREDPEIEMSVIARLKNQVRHPQVLLIASGGCTALSLLADPDLTEIVAIDLNPAQLHLVELKRQALLHLDLRRQYQLLGVDGGNDHLDRIEIYQTLRSHLPPATQAFWDDRPEQIAFGINRVGRFEQLFRELSALFSNLGLDPLIDPKTAIAHPQWPVLFETVFDREELIKVFGEAAVNYSMDRSFGVHFSHVFASALQRFDSAQNYFLTQVWCDHYPDNPAHLPLYLQSDVQTQIRQFGADRLVLKSGSFFDTLKLEQKKFDLIQFSNISDWMPLSDLHDLIHLGVQALNQGGAILGRRLNGDHHLATVMADHLVVDQTMSDQLLQSDRSFFYQEVVVGFKS